MFKRYLLLPWRNLEKNRTFTLINIIGLAIGLACFLLIALFVVNELSYDRFNKNADRISRVNVRAKFGEAELNYPLSPDLMGPLLKQDYPQVENYVRLYKPANNKLIRKGNEYINEYNVVYADSTLFDVFTLPLVAGDASTALNGPNKVVITESMAMRYFGKTDVVGKDLETRDGDRTTYKITAVIKDLPQTSHFNFQAFFSMKNANYEWGQILRNAFHTYLLLKPGVDKAEMEKIFSRYEDKYVLPQIQFMGVHSMAEFRKSGKMLDYSVTPLTDIHLHSDRPDEFTPPGNMQYVYIFSAVALFILLIACINFMNLATARSAKRAKEVGVRKVLGLPRKGLIGQFLIESVFLVAFSMVIAVLLASIALPFFNHLAGKELIMPAFFSLSFLPVLLGLTVLIGLLAGIYPAFFLSAFKPAEALKSRPRQGFTGNRLRSGLVVFQFFASIVLIIGTIIIYRQLNYIRNSNIGYSKDQVLIVNDVADLGANINSFREGVGGIAGVRSATVTSFLPVSFSSRADNIFANSPSLNVTNGLDMQAWLIDQDYIRTMGMQVIKGRDFSRSFANDSTSVIINETAAALLGYKDPVGQRLYKVAGDPVPYTIVGVVRNFNFESLKQHVGPLALFLGKSEGYASFKVDASNISGVLTQAERNWKMLAPGMPFSYRFLDDAFDDMYRSEQRTGLIVMLFSILSIFIACLGLFGLSSFMAEQRTREIGIRKVLGASVQHIVRLVSGQFMLLVALAFIIAVPFAWWAMNKWLADFAYRIHIQWWIFALAGGIAFLIALITMSFQAIKASLMNPVDSLRTE